MFNPKCGYFCDWVHTKSSDVNNSAERANGSWTAVCLHALYVEKLLNGYWAGRLLLYDIACICNYDLTGCVVQCAR